MMHLRPDDPVWKQRALRLAELSRDCWTGRNERGFLQFKSIYFSVDKVDIREPKGQASLIRLAKATVPGLLVPASGYGDGRVHADVAEAADFLLPHWNGTKVDQI